MRMSAFLRVVFLGCLALALSSAEADTSSEGVAVREEAGLGARVWQREGAAHWWKKCGGMQHRQPTVLQFYMKMKSKNKNEAKAGKSGTTAKRKGQKMRKTSMSSVSKIGFKVHDVGIGCMKELPKIGSFKTEKVYPFVGEAMHTSTRLRVIEIISYESSKYKKKKGGAGKNGSRQGTGADTSALTVKMLQKCKLAFTQTRDGHVNKMFSTKGSPSCKKIKAAIAGTFESFYFSKKKKNVYHIKVQQGSKVVPFRVTVKKDPQGRVKQVCRVTSRGARSSKLGPGGDKKKQMKPMKSTVRLCNTYTQKGNLFIGGMYAGNRQGGKKMKQMIKGRRRRAWVKFMKTQTKKPKGPAMPVKKAVAKVKAPRRGKRHQKKRVPPKVSVPSRKVPEKDTLARLRKQNEILRHEVVRLKRIVHARGPTIKSPVPAHVAADFDISKMSIPQLMALNKHVEQDIHRHRAALSGLDGARNPARVPKSIKATEAHYADTMMIGVGEGEDDEAGKPGKKATAKPAMASGSGQLIRMVKEEDTQAVELRSESDIVEFLGEAWGHDNLEEVDPEGDHHSNKGGWVDANPVLDIDYDRTMSLLQTASTKPEDEEEAYYNLIDMFERDPRTIKKVKNAMLTDQYKWGDEAHRAIVGAIGDVGDTHPQAQGAIIELMSHPEHHERAVLTAHSLSEPRPQLLAALHRRAFRTKPEVDQHQCLAILALGRLAHVMKTNEEGPRNEEVATHIANKLAEKALVPDSDSCYHEALGNAGPAAESAAPALMSQFVSSSSATRRHNLIQAIRDSPHPAVDTFLQEQFYHEKRPVLRETIVKALSGRKSGVATETAITNLANNYDLEKDAVMNKAVQMHMIARAREFHSPAALSLIETLHASEAHLAIMKNVDLKKVPDNISPTKCTKVRPDMKWSCGMGIKKCIKFKGAKIGCLGAMGFAYLDWKKTAGMKLGPITIPAFTGDAAGGIVGEFMMFTKTLLDVGLMIRLKMPQFFFKVWLKKFDMKTMSLATVFEFKKGNMPDPTEEGDGDGGDDDEDGDDKKRVGESAKGKAKINPMALVMGALEKAKPKIKPPLCGFLNPVDACKAKQPMIKFVPSSKGKAPACEGGGDDDEEGGDDDKKTKLGESMRMKPKKVGVNAKGETLKGFSELTFRKTLFTKAFNIGVPVIQKLECNIRLSGMMGVQYGFAVDEKTLIVAMAQATPLINIVFKFSAYGKAGPIAGGIITKLTLADIALPVNAVVAPLALSMGYDISWKVKALIADIKAFVRGPGMKCKNKAGRDPGGRWLVRHKDKNKRIFIPGGKGKGKSKGKERGKRRMVLLSESVGDDSLSFPGIPRNSNPTPAKALALQYQYAVEHGKRGKTRLGEGTKFIGGLSKLASNLAMPCLTTPCNLWWVPKACGLKCGIGKGCKMMKGEIPIPSLYKWPGITKGGAIITKNPKCVRAPPPQKAAAAEESEEEEEKSEKKSSDDDDEDGDDKLKKGSAK